MELLKNMLQNNLSIKLNCTHPIKCTIFCKLVEGNISSNGNYNVCSSEYRPSKGLVHLMNYTFLYYSKDDIGNQGNISYINFTADTTPPKFGTIEIINIDCNIRYDNIGVPTVTDDADQNPILSSTIQNITPCLLLRKWSAVDRVGNTQMVNQTIELKSYLKLSYSSSIYVPCVTNDQVINDISFYNGFISVDNNSCNATLTFKPAYSPLPTENCDFTFTVKWSIKDNCMNSYSVTQNVVAGVRETPYSPYHLQIDVDPNVIFFKWPFYRNSASNELFLMESNILSATRIASTNKNYFTYQKLLKQNQTYNWYIAYSDANNSSVKKTTPSWQFRTKIYADIVLNNVKVLSEVKVGSKIEIRWTAKNLGKVTTSSSHWSDAVYGSPFDIIDQSKLIGLVKNNFYLEPNGEYTSNFYFNIDERYISEYFYVFIVVDYYHEIEDSNYLNNVFIKPMAIKILQVPLPNFTPTSIVVFPTIAKSNEEIQLKLRINNTGSASTKLTDEWTDLVQIKLVDNLNTIYNERFIMRELQDTKSSYYIYIKFTVPLQYYGNAFIRINVNVYNTLYEFNDQDNTLEANLTIIPPETANLEIINYPNTLSCATGDLIEIKYVVENTGYAKTNVAHWIDYISIISMNNNLEILGYTVVVYGKFNSRYENLKI